MTSADDVTNLNDHSDPADYGPVGLPEGVRLGRLPLSQILFRSEWNARHGRDVMATVARDGAEIGFDPEKDGTGLGGDGGTKTAPGLVEMLLAQGQLQPIDVRPTSNPVIRDARPVETVDGHRRGAALEAIAKAALESEASVAKGGKPLPLFLALLGPVPSDWKKFDWRHPITKDRAFDAREPSALVLLRDMSEFEARQRNLNGQTSSTRLSTPDLAYGISELRKAAKKEGRDLTDEAIALSIGKSRPLVSQLTKIMSALPPSVTTHWREGGVATVGGAKIVALAPLSLQTMVDLASLDGSNAEKEEAYVKRVMETREPGKRKTSDTERKKLDNAIKKAAHLGKVLAWAKIAIGDLTKRITPGEWNGAVEELVRFTRPGNKPPTDDQMKQLVLAMKEAFKDEQERLVREGDGADEEEDEGEAQKKRGKRDGGK